MSLKETKAYPYANDVVQDLLEGEKPGLDNYSQDAHEIKRKPPDGNKAAEEEHPPPQLEIDHPLQPRACQDPIKAAC